MPGGSSSRVPLSEDVDLFVFNAEDFPSEEVTFTYESDAMSALFGDASSALFPASPLSPASPTSPVMRRTLRSPSNSSSASLAGGLSRSRHRPRPEQHVARSGRRRRGPALFAALARVFTSSRRNVGSSSCSSSDSPSNRTQGLTHSHSHSRRQSNGTHGSSHGHEPFEEKDGCWAFGDGIAQQIHEASIELDTENDTSSGFGDEDVPRLCLSLS